MIVHLHRAQCDDGFNETDEIQTLPIKPVLTKNLRIELTGENLEEGAFNDVVEIDPTKELDLYKDKEAANATGQLRIVEIEFYE